MESDTRPDLQEIELRMLRGQFLREDQWRKEIWKKSGLHIFDFIVFYLVRSSGIQSLQKCNLHGNSTINLVLTRIFGLSGQKKIGQGTNAV